MTAVEQHRMVQELKSRLMKLNVQERNNSK